MAELTEIYERTNCGKPKTTEAKKEVRAEQEGLAEKWAIRLKSILIWFEEKRRSDPSLPHKPLALRLRKNASPLSMGTGEVGEGEN